VPQPGRGPGAPILGAAIGPGALPCLPATTAPAFPRRPTTSVPAFAPCGASAPGQDNMLPPRTGATTVPGSEKSPTGTRGNMPGLPPPTSHPGPPPSTPSPVTTPGPPPSTPATTRPANPRAASRQSR
jgi:hypothetical protein